MAKIVKNNISYTSIPSSASMVPYDNYDSGLEATNVKDAIDELAEGGTGVHTLEGLDDVTISSATNGQVLKYNGTDWVNADDSGGVSTLDELTDVSISSATNGQVLKYNGSEWINAAESGGGASVLTDLTDVSIASASNGQVLTYNFGDWVNMDLPSPSISLDNLTNVSIASPSNNQVLKYDNGTWVNANDSGGTTVIANPSGSSTADLTKLQVDNVIYDIPSGGSNVSVTQIQSTGTKIATITVDSVATDIYSPAGGGSSLNDLSNVNITSPSDKQVLAYDDATNKWINSSSLVINPFSLRLTHGQVSTTSDYATATFTSIATNKYVLVHGYDSVSGTNYSSYALFSVDSIESGKSFTLTLHTDVTFRITTTSISTTWYGGTFCDIYADIYVTDTLTGITDIGDLADVHISSATAGQVLKYDSANSQWINADDSAGAIDLADLDDVTISSVTNGQVLTYNNGVWENANSAGGASSADLISFDDTNVAFTADDVQEAFEEITKTLTMSEYNSLSSAEKNNGTIYLISDAPSSYPDIDELNNVNISSPTDGQVLKYDNATSKWVNGTGGGGGSSTLSGLSDVDITSVSDGQTLKYDNATSKWINATSSSGGHTILNNAGTSLTQRNDLQFKGAYSADNNTDAITEVNVVREMTKAQFNLLSADEKVGLIHITDESDAAPLADLPDVNLTSPSNGQVLKYDSTNQEWVNANESGGSGGHTIVDEDGTSLTQRTNLQFNGAYLEDNSTDDTTEVNVVRSMTRAEFDLLSADEKVGIINITNESMGMATWTDLTGTLTTGSTSITISSADITTNSVIEVFDSLDIPYNSKTLTTGSITLEFDAQQSDMTVMVRVS